MTNNKDELLQYAIDNGIIDLQNVQQQIEMKKRQKILNAHPYDIIYNEKRGRWFTRFKVDGVLTQRHRGSREELESLIVEFYLNGEKFDDSKSDEENAIPFQKAHDRWEQVQEEYGKEPNTLYRYHSDWNRFFLGTEFAKKNILTMTSYDIESFMINTIKEKRLKRQAGIDLFGYIKGVFYTAVIDRVIPKDENPCDLVDKKRFRKYYNRDKKSIDERTLSISEIQKLVERLNKDVTERPTCLSPYGVRLALLTGMRSGEICGLRWSHISDCDILICESEKYNQRTKTYYNSETKTEKDRTMPITKELKDFFDDMKKLQERYGRTEDFVISVGKKKLHTRNLSDYMIKASKKLGFNVSKNIHAIRRTFNSYLRQDGTSAILAGSIIGNTAAVNDKHYTYDICDLDTKHKLVAGVENKMLANCKFA